MGTGLTKGHATWSSIPLKRQFSNLLEDMGGNPQSFAYGPDILAAWIDQPAKYMALKKLIHFLRQMYNCNQLQFGFNSEKLGGLKRDDFVQLLNAFTADNRLVKTDFASGRVNHIQQSGISIDDSDNMSGVNDFEAATATISDKLTVDGLIDPTGLEFTQQATNPGGVAVNTTWIDSSNGHLRRGSVDLEGGLIHRTTTGVDDNPTIWQYNNYLIAVAGTVSTPATPSNGDKVHVKNDAGSTKDLTVDTPGAETIDGDAVLVLKKGTGASVTLIYHSGTTDWKVWSIA